MMQITSPGRASRVAALVALALLGAASVPATAAASTGPSPGAVRSAPIAVPAPPPPAGSLRLSIPHAYVVQRHDVTIPGRSIQVTGVVRPYMADQWVTVRALLGARVIKTDHLLVRPAARGTYGTFTETLSSPGVGTVTVSVEHSATAAQAAFHASQQFASLDTRVGFGSTGWFVQLLQQRLAALHFYLPQSGVYDLQTGLAVDAYHRLLRRGTSQLLDHATITWLLNGWGTFPVHDPRGGRHAEGDLTLQLLALINGRHVERIYPISSGKPSTPTVLGHFRVYSKVPGLLPDGMFFSSFFFGGYAIHGYDPAPDYPASHGCMRLPMTDAISVYNWLSVGDVVDTYF